MRVSVLGLVVAAYAAAAAAADIHAAVSADSSIMIREALDAGASVDTVGPGGQTPLMAAVLQGKVSEHDLAECRAAFARLELTGNGRLSIEDIELARQSKLLRVAPKLRERRLRRLRKGLRQALASRAEALFPHWRRARGESKGE